MTTQHIDTLIIGAGQAGLATGYFLAQRGLEFLIVDGAHRIGDNWREQWDTLRLYTPAKYDGLPGLRVPGRRPVALPGQGRGRRLPGGVRAALGSAGADEHSGGDAGARPRRRLPRDPGSGRGEHDQLQPGGDRYRDLRPHPVGSGRGGRSRSRHRATALQRVPAAGSAAQRAGARGGGLALRQGRRLRRRPDPRDDPLRPRPRRARRPARVTSRPDRCCRCIC